MEVLFDPRLRLTAKTKQDLRKFLPTMERYPRSVKQLIVVQGKRNTDEYMRPRGWQRKTWWYFMQEGLGMNHVADRLLGNVFMVNIPSDRDYLRDMNDVEKLVAMSEQIIRVWRPTSQFEWDHEKRRNPQLYRTHPHGLPVKYDTTLKVAGKWPALTAHKKAYRWFQNFMVLLSKYQDAIFAAWKVEELAPKCEIPMPLASPRELNKRQWIIDAINSAPRSPFAAGDKTQPIITTLENT